MVGDRTTAKLATALLREFPDRTSDIDRDRSQPSFPNGLTWFLKMSALWDPWEG